MTTTNTNTTTRPTISIDIFPVYDWANETATEPVGFELRAFASGSRANLLSGPTYPTYAVAEHILRTQGDTIMSHILEVELREALAR